MRQAGQLVVRRGMPILAAPAELEHEPQQQRPTRREQQRQVLADTMATVRSPVRAG